MKSWRNPSVRSSWTRTLPLAVLSLLLLLPTGGLASTPEHARAVLDVAGSTPISWAYAGWGSVSSSGTYSGSLGSFQYDVHAFYAWAVVYDQTNTSSSTYSIQGQRTLLSVYFGQFCQPSCGASGAQVQNMTSLGHQEEHIFANLTDVGRVYVNGSGVPALALVNDSGSAQNNLTQTNSFQGVNPMGQPVSGWTFFASGATSQIAIAFDQPLGLVPLQSSPGQGWQSVSNFTEGFTFNNFIHVCQQVNGGPGPCGSSNPQGSSTTGGNASLAGSDLGTVVLNGGIVAQTDAFSLLDVPFAIWDGLFLVPAPGIVMPPPGGPNPPTPSPAPTGGSGSGGNGTPAPNGPGAPGSQGAPGTPGVPTAPLIGTDEIDVAPGLSHLGLVAAETSYQPPGPVANPQGPTTGGGAPPEPGSVSSARATEPLASSTSSSTSSSPGQTDIQAQPIAPSAAESLAAGWAAWSAVSPTPLGPPTPPVSFANVRVEVVVIVGVFLGAVVVYLVSSRRGSKGLPPEDPAFDGFRSPRLTSPKNSPRQLNGATRSRSPTPPGPEIVDDPMDHLL